MSKRADIAFISGTKEAVVRINAYTEHLSYEQFLEDKNNPGCCGS